LIIPYLLRQLTKLAYHKPSPMLFGKYHNNRILTITKTLICIIVFLYPYAVKAQDAAGVKKLLSSIESYQAHLPSEKVFLHFDKPYYTVGDTLWFKAYVFDAATYTASKLSSKLYVELLNDSSKVVTRFAIPLFMGLGQADIVLDEPITDGSYTLRAYTNWMQNFSGDVFFNKQFHIGKPTIRGGLLVNEQHTLKKNLKGNNQLSLNLQLTDLAKTAIPYRDVELRLTEGKHTLSKSNNITGDNGNISTNLNLPDKVDTRRLSLIVTDKTTKNKLSFPFYPGGEYQNIDLQFMPEGGNLIAGLNNRIAFKAIGEDGLGVAIKGIIVNKANQEINTFESAHNGMGNFLLVPLPGKTYTAKYTANGIMHTAVLPVTKPSGITFKVDNLSHPDSVLLYIRATADIAAAGKSYSLVARSADIAYLGVTVNLQRGFHYLRLPKGTFMSGIVSFTLLDGNTPVCERRIFIDHKDDRLQLGLIPQKPQYLPKDSVSLALNVVNADGKPVVSSLSVSVTDDSFVKNNTDEDNIISHLLLTSELKGYVEDPAWYFAADNKPEKNIALDNLMLTQGWTGFDWSKISQPLTTPKFEAEKDNHLSGRLTGFFNKGTKDAKVSIFAVTKKYGVFLTDTVTNANGEFMFPLPLFDTVAYTIRIANKKGKNTDGNIVLNEFTPTTYTQIDYIRPMPWYAQATNAAMLNYFNRPQEQLAGVKPGEVKGKLLKEVVIKGTKPPVTGGSQYGYLVKEVDEQQLVAARKTTLMDLIRQKIGGFHEGSMYRSKMFERVTIHPNANFLVGSDLVVDFVIDGRSTYDMFAEEYTGEPTLFREFIRGFLVRITADEVKNIKLGGGNKAFITITTRSGNGIGATTTPGIAMHRPVPFCLPRQFYKPGYTVKNDVANANRATVHWEPNLVTDVNGTASFSFFAADKPGSYTITVQGADMNGNFGYQTQKITITPQATANKTGK